MRPVALFLLVASGAAAQAPQPPPPDGHEGAEYLDAAGCAFVRFTLDGKVGWAPRLTENGDPVCGLTDVEAGPLRAEVGGTPRDPVFSVPGVYMQVGAFGGDAKAGWTMERLREAGYGALRLDMDWQPPIIVVFAGPFESRDAAEQAQRAVAVLGFSDAFLRVQE